MNNNIENGLGRASRAPLDLSRLNYRPEDIEVLQRSVTLKGEPLLDWISGKFQEPRNVAVVLFGESGAGKTTLAGQLAHLWSKTAWVTVISSGIFLTDRERELTFVMRNAEFEGKPVSILAPGEEFDRSKFSPQTWRWLASYLAGDINAVVNRSLTSDPRSPRPKVLVADIAGIGEKNGRLAAGLGEVAKAFPDNVVFLAVPGNPDIQDRALRLRKKAHSLLNEILYARGRERIGSLTPLEEKKIRDALVSEHLVTDTDLMSTLFSIREGTRPGRFEKAREVFVAEVVDWVSKVDYEETVGSVFRQLTIFQETGVFSMMDDYKQGLYARKLAYADDYLHRVLGTPSDSDQSRTVLVPYLNSTIHQWPQLLYQKSG